MSDEREQRATALWTDEVCRAYPVLPELVARLGSPPVRWYVEPAQNRDNAYFIVRTNIRFEGDRMLEDRFVEVQLRDQDYSESFMRYVVWHESGHALAYLMAPGGRYRDIYYVYERYNRSRGLPPVVVTQGDWPTLTQERFADDFWAAHDPSYNPHNGQQPAAGPLTNAAAMRAFFRELVDGWEVDMAEHLSDPAGHLLGFEISSPFGPRPGVFGFHRGIDFAMPAGTKIYAVREGVVVVDDDDAYYDESKPETWSGVAVWLVTTDGERHGYCHLARNVVVAGQRIVQGELLGIAGDTGAATGVHLHWERQVDGTPVDGMEELIVLSQEGQAQIRRIVREETAPGFAELLGALKSGFNTTLVVVARRILRRQDPGTAYPSDTTPVN